MIVDANVLLYAEDSSSPHHEPARDWLSQALNGPVRTGLPWPSLVAFLRIRTHPRFYDRPLDPGTAWSRITDWLAAPAAWVPAPGARHAEMLGRLVERYRPTSDLMPDVHLANLSLEHGVGVCSADADFARFEELTWLNPITP